MVYSLVHYERSLSSNILGVNRYNSPSDTAWTSILGKIVVYNSGNRSISPKPLRRTLRGDAMGFRKIGLGEAISLQTGSYFAN